MQVALVHAAPAKRQAPATDNEFQRQPLVAIALDLLLSPLIHAIDDWQRWKLTGSSGPAQRRCSRLSSR